MPTFEVTEYKDSSRVDGVLSLIVAPDGQDALLTLHFDSNIAVRLPMNAEVAMRLWAILDQARMERGWSAPSTPVSTDKLQ